jgi:hypothetical protein
MSDINATDDVETTPEKEAAKAVAEMRAELDKIKLDNARLQGRFDEQAHQRSQIPVSDSKTKMTMEEYNQVLKSDPKRAIQIAVEESVDQRVKPYVNNMETKAQRDKWDMKAENEFPSLVSDPEFEKAVKEQVHEMVKIDGRSPDDPTLLYRAAQITAGRLGKKSAPSRGGMSGEAPRGGRDGGERPSAFKTPGYFDAFNQVFGITTKEGKEKMAKRLERDSQPQRRGR